MREKRESLSNSDITTILKEGGEKARSRAAEKMKDIRRKVGVSIA